MVGHSSSEDESSNSPPKRHRRSSTSTSSRDDPDKEDRVATARREESKQSDSTSQSDSRASQSGESQSHDDDLKRFKIAFQARLDSISKTTDHSQIPQNRRLDSIARLIENSAICAAVCFDGENILVALNNEQSELAHYYFKHFRAILENPQMFNAEEITPEEEALIKRSCHQDLSKDRMRRDFLKVKNSLIGNDDTKFDDAIIEALKSEDTTKILDGTTDYEPVQGMHAEMQIIQFLLQNEKLNLEPDQTAKSLYIGLSRLCCAHCSLAIKAVNEVTKTDIAEVQEVGAISTRGDHGNYYPSWKFPKYLLDQEALFAAFVGEEAYGHYKKLEEEGDPQLYKVICELIVKIDAKDINSTRASPSTSPDRSVVPTTDEASSSAPLIPSATPATPRSRSPSPEKKAGLR